MARKIAQKTLVRLPEPELDAADAQLHYVIHFHGFVGEERLAIPLSDERAIVGVLRFHQGVEVLAGRKYFARRLCAVELAAIALNGSQFALELRSDVDDKSGLDRIFSVGQRVEQLVRTVGGPPGIIPLQAGQEACVASQL